MNCWHCSTQLIWGCDHDAEAYGCEDTYAMVTNLHSMEELPLDHEPCLEHWAKCLADDDIATGYHTNWDHAYEQAWDQLDAEYNYNYEYQGS
jgi:hypothetical protein